MPIEVLNHMWVGVFSGTFVAQYEEERRRIGSAPDPKLAEWFAQGSGVCC